MKMYATTTSERATKGQGGNQHVTTVHTVELADKSRVEAARTTITRDGEVYTVRHVPISGDETVTVVPIRRA